MSVATSTIQIALIGNPNTGKTTLFNRLTGTHQRVGNYPGVTVEKKVGTLKLPTQDVSLVDLPGTYSLAAASADERVAIDVLSGYGAQQHAQPPDAVICVVDACNLLRNLFLASQIADLNLPMVIVLNMTDAAQKQGIVIDTELLAERLGAEVVQTTASRGIGMDTLKLAIERALGPVAQHAKMPGPDWPPAVIEARDAIAQHAATATGGDVSNTDALRMLFDVDTAIPERLGWNPADAQTVIHKARASLDAAGLNAVSAEALLRYGWLSDTTEGVITHTDQTPLPRRSETVDRIFTDRVWGVVVLLAIMTLVFQSIYTLAVPMMDGIDALTGMLGSLVGGWLVNLPMLQSLVVDGIIGGVGSVIIFLPQILILFFAIALLEDTGYMARAAFLLDRLFAWCGLNGRSFVPMLSSYACAIPGVMSARTIDDPKARLVTILIAPLMSCSARLPVYVLLIGAFIEPLYGPAMAGFALVAMHMVGLFFAIPIAWIFRKTMMRGPRVPFVMEMPPYRAPQLRNVIWRMWQSALKFLKRAGTIIFAMTIIIWALSSFPRPASVADDVTATFIQEQQRDNGASEDAIRAALVDEASSESAVLAGRIDGAYLEQSYLGRAGKAAQPIFDPAGFDWKITVGVLASFPAREVIVATMGILYNLGGEVDEGSTDLAGALRASRWESGKRAGQPVFTPLVAVGIMIFFALCLQCGSTVAVIARESSWGWAIFAFVYMTALAWLAAVAVYQIGSALG
ncbi:MAG: ferrous iron transport protein B [Phycisphaerales bacterium]